MEIVLGAEIEAGIVAAADVLAVAAVAVDVAAVDVMVEAVAVDATAAVAAAGGDTRTSLPRIERIFTDTNEQGAAEIFCGPFFFLSGRSWYKSPGSFLP